MVDMYGRWFMEQDYSVYPEEKWCDYDYVANWIMSLGYKPETSFENVTHMIIAHYELWKRENNEHFYTDITDSENGDGWMISTKDVSCFVADCGGLAEFDYYC